MSRAEMSCPGPLRHRDPAGRGGFSLLELLAVLGIISALAAIALPRYVGLQDGTRASVMKADLYHLRLMQEQYMRQGASAYAGSVAELRDLFSPSPGVSIEILEADGDAYEAVATHVDSRQRCTYSSVSGVATCEREDSPDPNDPAPPSGPVPTSDSASGSR